MRLLNTTKTFQNWSDTTTNVSVRFHQFSQKYSSRLTLAMIKIIFQSGKISIFFKNPKRYEFSNETCWKYVLSSDMGLFCKIKLTRRSRYCSFNFFSSPEMNSILLIFFDSLCMLSPPPANLQKEKVVFDKS